MFDGYGIDRIAKLLLTLTNNKWPLGIDPGGHHFVVLNVSINNTPVFVSEVVIYATISIYNCMTILRD